MLQEIYTPKQIYDINTETLQKVVKKSNKPFTIKTNSQLWIAYTIYRINEENINKIYTDELSIIVSKFTCATCQDTLKTNNINLEKLEKHIKSIYIENLDKYSNKDAYRETIDYIFNIFKTDMLFDFELINKSLTVYLKSSELEKFNELTGESNREKFLSLLL